MAENTLTVRDVIEVLEEFAPTALAEEWDSVGLQVGNPEQTCRTVAIGLDVTHATLETALSQEADLIICHHPLLFRPPPAIRFDKPQGHLIQQLCEAKISCYAMHTNLDSTVGGLNDHLATILNLIEVDSLIARPPQTPPSFQDKVVGLGRVGRLKKPGTLAQLARQIDEALSPESLRIIGHEHGEVQRVAVCTGSGGSLVHDAIKSGADCFVTGDVKYHQALDAEAAGMYILDVGHYASEISCISILCSLLANRFGDGLELVPLDSLYDPLRSFK